MSKENVTEGVCIDIYNLLKFRADAYNAITDVCAHCSDLMEKVEELERQHKADQKAVEEANQIAETYMKRCQELYDKLKKAEKSAGDIAKPVVDMLNRLADTHINVKFEKASLEVFSTAELMEELSKREGVSRKDIEPHTSDIGYFEGPAIVLTVID